ncbi:MAG: alanine racemase [Nitrospinales bacterium]
MALHRATIAEIDLGAFRHNLRLIRTNIPEKVKIMAVVKADAYGHGAIPCAKAALKEGADYLGVGIIAEGIELRESGITAPIQLLTGIFPDEAEDLIEYDLSTTIYTQELAETISKIAKTNNKTVGVHLKVNTGMGRLGASIEAIPKLAPYIDQCPNLKLESIFTHLSSADYDPDYTHNQLDRFEKAIKKVRELGIKIPVIHSANSAALMRFPESYYDMVRPGLLLYGILPSPSLKPYAGNMESGKEGFIPVMQWKTHILQINKTPANTPLSYGQKFITKRDSLIATLPIGYADGLSRGLSNKMKVLIKGKVVPQIGTICMDMILVDVTDIADVSLNDEVVLIGKQGNEVIGADQMAEFLNTVPYEILCNVGKRVPRVYKS